MTTRKKIILIGGIVLGLLLVLLLWVLVLQPNTEESLSEENTQVSSTPTLPVIEQKPIVEAPLPGAPTAPTDAVGAQDPEVAVKQLSRTFVERFATYSNQNENAHLVAVQDIMTPSMASWATTQTVSPEISFTGVTTQVLSTSVSEISDTSASVLIQTRQIIETDHDVETVMKSGKVVLLFDGEQWLVDGFYWDR